MDISYDFVERYHNMDPQTETLLLSRDVRNGMVVLIEDPERRVDMTREGTADLLYKARKNNRWCRVTELEVDEYGTMRFIGVYADRTKMSRECTYYCTYWLVKLESLSEVETKRVDLPLGNCTIIQEFDMTAGFTLIRHVREGEDEPNVSLKVNEYAFAENLLGFPKLEWDDRTHYPRSPSLVSDVEKRKKEKGTGKTSPPQRDPKD